MGLEILPSLTVGPRASLGLGESWSCHLQKGDDGFRFHFITVSNAVALPGAPPAQGTRAAPRWLGLSSPHPALVRVSCDSASVWSLSLPPRPPASQAWTRALSPSGGHLERSPSPPHRQGRLAPAPTHAGCRRLGCAPLRKPTLSQWESLHPKMPRKLLTTALHSGLAHSQ